MSSPIGPNNPFANFSSVPTETSGSIDNDPAFVHAGSAVWQAYNEYNKNPNDANVEALMLAVNKLNKYFTDHPPAPTQALNPHAYGLYVALNDAAPGAPSLAAQCSYYDPTTTHNDNACYLQVQHFEKLKSIGQDEFAGVFFSANKIGDRDSSEWYNRDLTDANNKMFHDDVVALKTAIDNYDNDSSGDPDIHKLLLAKVAKAIGKVWADGSMKDTSGNPLMADGYLQGLISRLGANGLLTTARTSDSLAVLAGKVAGASPTADDYSNFEKALNGQSIALGTQPQNASSLDQWIAEVLYNEYK